jgi:hypothetical protein
MLRASAILSIFITKAGQMKPPTSLYRQVLTLAPTRMKTVFIKYKWRILYWLILLAFLIYFQPRQSDYYLSNDISNLKKFYLNPILIWSWVTICVLFLLVLFIKTKSVKNSFPIFLLISIMTALPLFIFQDLFLAGSLFVNRQFKRGSLTEYYIVNYLAGTPETKETFFPYDISLKDISTDPKLINKLYRPKLKQNDTITLKFDKGLLGIKFQSPLFR